MGLDKQWRMLAMIFIVLALIMPVATAFAGIGIEDTVNKTHEGIQGGTGTGEYTVRFTTTSQQPGSYPAESTEISTANIGWYETTRGNEPPNITQIYITSNSGLNLATDDLTCSVNATDSDNTTLTINYNWYNNSVQIPSLSGQATAISGAITSISTINNALTTGGENWTCEARAWDGYYYEPKWNNASVIITEITPPGGSKGGAGGGGVQRKPIKECSEAWACTDWSACNITRTRNCTDINNCGKEQYKPALSEICELRPVEKPKRITEIIREEQKAIQQYPQLTEIPLPKPRQPTAVGKAWLNSNIIRDKTLDYTARTIHAGFEYAAGAAIKTAHLITAIIHTSIDIQIDALHKTIDIISKTINTIELIITKSSQEQAGIITKIIHAAAEILKTAINAAKTIILGTIQVIKGAIHLSIEAAETAITSAREAAAKTTETTQERTATAAGMAATIIAILTPENIEFILVAIIYLALIAAAITAIRYFIRQYLTEERSRRLRTETRVLLAISVILQAMHFIIFQRELYPSYLAVIAMIAVFAFDLLLKKLPSIERTKEREEEKQHDRLLKTIRENREEIERAEEIKRKLARITAPRPISAEPFKTAEKQRFTKIKNMIQQIKESRIKETTIHTLREMKQKISQIKITSPLTKIKEYLEDRKQNKLLDRINKERLEIKEQSKQITERKKQAIEQKAYEKEHKKEVTYDVKEEQEKWQKLEKNIQEYKEKKYAAPELPASRYEKIKEEIMALEKPHETPKARIKLPKIRYEPIKTPKQPEKYGKEIGNIIQFQKKLDKYLKETPAKTKTAAKQDKKTKYEWVKREIRKMERKR